jgi:predicted acyl esterase
MLAYYLSQDARKGALENLPTVTGEAGLTVDYDIASDAYFAFWPQPLDDHGLVYDSAPLDAPLELLGFPVAHVALQLDRSDANVFVYLEEVKADGEVEVLSFGRLMVSHRALSDAPWDTLGLPWHSGREADVAPLGAGETADMIIGMGALSRRVPAGSRLRFVVTGADPRQRNLAEIREDPAPRITVLHGWSAGSRIELPLAPVTGK